jgi:hypothetical protein
MTPPPLKNSSHFIQPKNPIIVFEKQNKKNFFLKDKF